MVAKSSSVLTQEDSIKAIKPNNTSFFFIPLIFYVLNKYCYDVACYTTDEVI